MLGIDFMNVFIYQNGADNFTAQLLRLYAKADVLNRMKLAGAYPEESLLYEWWLAQTEPPTEADIMAKAKELSR